MVNMNDFLKQAKVAQDKFAKLQQDLEKKQYTGVAGDNAVTIVLGGDRNIKSIKIDQSIINPEEKEILEDLLMAAFNQAMKKLEEDAKSTLTSAFPMGGGGGLPF